MKSAMLPEIRARLELRDQRIDMYVTRYLRSEKGGM